MNRSLLAALAGFAVALFCAHGRSTPYDNYVLLADAFLHHRLWIDWPGPHIDAIVVDGLRIVVEAPLPALLLVPLVAIFGPQGWTETLLACAFCGVATGAAWELTERYGVNRNARIEVVAFFVAGTDLLWCAMLGDVWLIAHVFAVAFTLLALVEIAGKRRGWLVAAFAVCALESRFPLVLALLPYAVLLWTADRRVALRRYGAAIAVLALDTALHAWYDQARFGTIADVGFRIFYAQYEHQTQSMFRLQNLGLQLDAFFLKPPIFTSVAPYVRLDIFGVALPWTSPALVLAFLARPAARTAIVLWAAVLLCAAPSFLYYDRGGAQFGMRHALDFEPFVFALILIGVRDGIPVWGRVLIAYSVAVGFWAISYWNTIYRPFY